MEAEGSIQCSQEPFTGPYPEPYRTLKMSDLQIMIQRMCDFLSPPVSSIASGPCLDPKHHQPLHLHRTEEQLSYLHEAMHKIRGLFRPI
jgi:hypothetical protein